MTIWVDADACPNIIKDIIFKASRKRKIPVVLVANHAIYVPDHANARSIQVPQGMDVADTHIVEQVEAGDIVITADIPLAARIVERGAFGINPRGEEYTEDNVRSRLSVRDFLQDLRDSGVQTGGPPPLGDKDKRRFANALDRAITKRKRS